MEASSEPVGAVGCMRSRSPVACPLSTTGQSSGYRTADLLLFFHGGLCGSDQLLASALRFPPSIQHFLLPNRLGYLRSDPPPPWVDELRQPQPVRGRGRRGEKNELEFAAVYRHRMRSQAALFEDLVRQQIRNLSTNSLGEPQLHLLGVGEGCAHAIIYASCFPRRVRSLVLLGPLLELREHSENGPLENLILKRIRVYRQLTSRLPAKAFKPSLPPPRISFLEWLAAGFSQAAPKTALSNLLQLIGYPTSDRGAFLSSEQLLAALQQQQPMQQQLLLQPRSESSSEGHLRTHGNEGASWRMQQQEAWERQREVYRQLVLRLQHLTGSCCLQHRLLGFLEDALILTAHVGGAASENQRSKLLLQDLEQLQVPAGLVVLAGGSQDSHYPFFQTLEKSRWDVLELPEASPKTLLLSHADLLNSKLHEFYLRCSL
ncbi:hypothetical protein Emag_004425 [Eimeria magna]